MDIRKFLMLALLVVGCTSEKPARQADSSVLAREKCTSDGIFACTQGGGGEGCFSRCNTKPSEKYCSMSALDKCLDNRGGSACFEKNCGAGSGGGSGAFSPPNSSGLVKLPSAGPGYEAYDVDWMRYGQAKTIARIKTLAQRVYAKTGYKIFIGDLSDSSGGNSGRHSGHYDGLEVDIAIMGNTTSIMCYNYWDGCYNRRAQIAVIDEIRAMGGASSVLFNDWNVQSVFPQFVSSASGHDNHIHVNW